MWGERDGEDGKVETGHRERMIELEKESGGGKSGERASVWE